MKLRLVGAELFHADRRTDMTKLIVAFRNFVNASKKNACAVIWNIQALVALLDTVTCIKGQTDQKLDLRLHL